MAVTTKQGLKDYCLRRLGEPVIHVNVDPDQVDDRIDEALQYFQEFHGDHTERAFVKHLVTSTDVTNEYITVASDIIFVKRIIPISAYANTGMFSFEYQFNLNNMANLYNFMGDIAYYEQMKQHLSLIDMEFSGTPQLTFTRRKNRLYLHGDFADTDVKAGEYLIVEVYQIVDPVTNTSIYDDLMLKDYVTALIKRQWGQNMGKFEGMQLPGGVTISGRDMLVEANEEIRVLQERIRLEQELPPDFLIG